MERSLTSNILRSVKRNQLSVKGVPSRFPFEEIKCSGNNALVVQLDSLGCSFIAVGLAADALLNVPLTRERQRLKELFKAKALSI